MSNFDFGKFQAYIDEEHITDINYNGHEIWIDHIEKGRYKVSDVMSAHEVENFCYRFANYANKQFNYSYPILESETDTLRISLIHNSIAKSGYSISIRKTPPYLRLHTEELIASNYATKQLVEYLESKVKKRKNILISGLPGVGKTELLKYLTTFIVGRERVITIEDNLEIRYNVIHKDKDSVVLKINQNVDYRDAIKASLRQRVDWLLLSEVRGQEVVELLQAVSTGSSLISTIHAESAKLIPKRLLHMFPGNEIANEKIMYRIFETIDVGIHIESLISEAGIQRYIQEVVTYHIDEFDQFQTEVIYEHSKGMVKK
ncbi:MAG: CpaF family protein [Erysipelothrix sp.]|nr:CpaF family protein [Erysipelothrix sp.]